ncbi:MAG: hypothetical protein ACK4WH_13170 [Phycisphaerales bacterium]
MIEALLGLMSRALEGIQDLPLGVHLLIGLAMAAGLVLWLAGQKVLKPLVVTLLTLLGGVIGGLAVPASVWGQSLSPWHGIGMGALVGLLVGLLLYRSAMAVGFGVVLGALMPLGAATILHYYPLAAPDEKPGGVSLIDEPRWRDAAGDPGFVVVRAVYQDKAAALAETPIPENLKPAAECIGTFWNNLTESIKRGWSELPGSHQAIVALSGVVGLAGGILTGLAMPAWASAAATSMFGAAVWMSCFVWLCNAFGAPWKQALDRSAPQWLAAWAVAAVVGLVVQWRMGRRSKGKPSGAPAAA